MSKKIWGKNIRITLELRETLRSLKRGGESYDGVIRRLVKEVSKK